MPRSRPPSDPLTSTAPADKLARHRLSVLEMAQGLGNVTEACRRTGMSRARFYEYQKRFNAQGMAGLLDLPPIAKHHPFTTAPETVEKILALSLEHPSWGCIRLAALLKHAGTPVSSPTIQTILIKHDLGTRKDRWLALERRAMTEEGQDALSGELLCQDVVTLGSLMDVGRVVAHTVVDTYGSVAFSLLHTSKTPEAAATLLHNDVFPFYEDRELPVGAILTDNCREFYGTITHPFQLFLALYEVQHRTTKIKHPWTNGFVERFHRTLKEEFVMDTPRTRPYESLEALQVDLDSWLAWYNGERPHLGYRNQGRRPLETVANFLDNRTINPTVSEGT